LAGVCVGAGGRIIEYKTEADGRLSFSNEGWKNFIGSTDLQLKEVVLINSKTTTHKYMRMMIEIINDLADLYSYFFDAQFVCFEVMNPIS
jgi:hypothetical protein